MNRTRLKTGLFLYVVAQILFLLMIQFPVKYNFDEFHYVPAAKQFITFDRIPNLEHPPLAKYFMAVGIAVFGDRPIGWRVMSTVFGSLTLVGMYLWGFALFRNEKYARYVAAITLFNQLLYVQARIGMLDTFMFAFLAWGMAYFTASWDTTSAPDLVKKNLWRMGICFGLATACKWFAVIPWMTCGVLTGFIFVFKHWGLNFSNPNKKDDWYSAEMWVGVRAKDIWISFTLLPLLIYFLAFLPYSFFKVDAIPFYDVIALQVRMWGDQLRVVSSHPYMSQWKDWIIPTRPIWYSFDSEPGDKVRGVLLLGNPFMMWTGLLALVFCFGSWVRIRSREAFLVLVFYTAFFGSWVVIPRKVSFYYYYYPAGMVLSLAIAYVFYAFEKKLGDQTWIKAWRWLYCAVAMIFFIYFFPILSGMKIGSQEFRGWMWLNSWI